MSAMAGRFDRPTFLYLYSVRAWDQAGDTFSRLLTTALSPLSTAFQARAARGPDKEPSMSSEIEITSSNFQTEIVDSSLPVLVDFWADWCMPCKMIAPSIEQIASTYKGRIKVGKVNVDSESELAGRFGINSIPTLILFKGGEVVAQRVGALPKHSIEELVKSSL
jgi:thioredoxin 1